jgi:hypothetical protein
MRGGSALHHRPDATGLQKGAAAASEAAHPPSERDTPFQVVWVTGHDQLVAVYAVSWLQLLVSDGSCAAGRL